ncbi:hypothetical protein SCLCIDRAFT_145314, partial [Scleroderma citrinum Foug A]
IEHMMKDWTSNIYTFYTPVPAIEHVDGRRCHIFRCLGKSCKQSMWCFLDTGNKASTSNMRKHIKSCWGDDVLTTVCQAAKLDVACDVVKDCTVNRSITKAFKCKRKGTTYSTRPHSAAETWYVYTLPGPFKLMTRLYFSAEMVCWVAENLWPYKIVRDRAFQCLMKTG